MFFFLNQWSLKIISLIYVFFCFLFFLKVFQSNVDGLRSRSKKSRSDLAQVRTVSKSDDSNLTSFLTHHLWLLIVAITVHNIPEGLAVGIGFGGVGQYPESTFDHARSVWFCLECLFVCFLSRWWVCYNLSMFEGVLKRGLVSVE